MGWHGNYVISHHANVLIVENNNILWHLGGPLDQTCTHKNCHKVQERSYITYLKPLNGNSFSLVFPKMFNILINSHEYANEIIIIYAIYINKFVVLYYWCNNKM